MLRAVVLEDALEVGHARDQPQVPEEDRDADQLLDDHEHEPVRDRVREQVGQAGRQQEEQADREHQREHDRARPRAAADLLLLAVLVRRHLRVGGDAERAKADLERLGQRDHAAHDRQAQQAVALGPRDERLRDHLDLAARALLGVGPAGRELLLRRLAHRHRPGRDAAHHHALEHGLAADRGVLGGLPHLAGVCGRGDAHRTDGIGASARPVELTADRRRRPRARCRTPRTRRSRRRGPPRPSPRACRPAP